MVIMLQVVIKFKAGIANECDKSLIFRAFTVSFMIDISEKKRVMCLIKIIYILDNFGLKFIDVTYLICFVSL